MPNETPERELIEILASQGIPGAVWQPFLGEEALDLIASQTGLSQEEQRTLGEESVAILSHCVPPTEPDTHHSGLVVGSIQSGKTLSFTTVAALARDNHYRIVIVITGTVRILNNQSVKRLTTLLRINKRNDYAWRLIRNPRPHAAQAQEIHALLQDWESPIDGGLQPQTLLITVLKHATPLRKLARLLSMLDLESVPSLVIDDEADQAGLNTAVNRGGESATYRALQDVRNSLPHHTYLGYTATPQAPLLINIMDVSAAKFVQVLTAGVEYAGGTAFFEHVPSLIRTIPSTEVPSKENPITQPPPSLLEAMRSFFVAVGAGMLDGSSHGDASQKRSMLIHPSMLTAEHAAYARWVQTIKASWSRLLDSRDQSDEFDRRELISSFERAHSDLRQTAPEIPEFEEILPILAQAVRRTTVQEINKRRANPFPNIDDVDEFWSASYSYILVGGQSLERGFTVEGLTTTYMPRGIGAGQADTVQQRARFYGYNRGHLGYCRVYLEAAARDAYQSYIDHEDRLRSSLADHGATGRPLSEWRRTFFLDVSLKPTRDAVLDIDYSRGPRPQFPYSAMPPLDVPTDLEENRQLIENLLAEMSFVPDEGDPRRTLAQRHEVAHGASARSVFEDLILPLRIGDPVDSWTYLQIRLQIQRYLESRSGALCTVFRMRPHVTEFERTLARNGKIEPYQGPNRPTGYPGDRQIYDRNRLSVQVYEFSRVMNRDGEVFGERVPQIAVILPEEIALGMVAQDQGIGR